MTTTDPVATIVSAMVDALNAADLSMDITATAPDFLEVEPTDHDLYVAVFPREEDTEAWFTDDTDRSEIEAAVLIRQNLESYDAATVAGLKTLAREIRNVLRNAHPLCQIGEYDVNLWRIRHQPLWSPELLRKQQLFLSIIAVTYRAEFEPTNDHPEDEE